MKFLQANGLPHPYVMLFLAPLFWATSNVTGKLGKAWLSPYAFTFWRWLLATALLSLLFRRQIRADWPQLKARAGWLFVVGGSGFALFKCGAVWRFCPWRECGQCVDDYRADSARGAVGGCVFFARAGASAAMAGGGLRLVAAGV